MSIAACCGAVAMEMCIRRCVNFTSNCGSTNRWAPSASSSAARTAQLVARCSYNFSDAGEQRIRGQRANRKLNKAEGGGGAYVLRIMPCGMYWLHGPHACRDRPSPLSLCENC